jgi:hypothetical protein
MEEQRISLSHVLLKDPKLDVDGAVEEFRRRLADALAPTIDPTAVTVNHQGNLVTVDLGLKGTPPETHTAVLATFAEVREAWIFDLNQRVSA